MIRERRGYGGDLAYIHDVGFSGYARGAAPGIVAILRGAGLSRGRVVELGCGSGVLAARLASRGFEVLGVDASPAMIRLARANAPGAAFRIGSLWSTALPRCSAIVSIGECVNYLTDANAKLAGIVSLARRAYAALEPGGVFLFDFAEPGQIAKGTKRFSGRSGPDWAVLVTVREDRRRGLLVREIVSYRDEGRGYRRREETHHLRTYAAPRVLEAVRRAGFTARLVRALGSLRLPPRHAAIVARKPRYATRSSGGTDRSR